MEVPRFIRPPDCCGRRRGPLAWGTKAVGPALGGGHLPARTVNDQAICLKLKKLDCAAAARTRAVKHVDRLRLPPTPVAINNQLMKLEGKAVLQGARQI